MTKLGWSILALILLVGAGFASLVSIGSSPPTPAITPVAPPSATIAADTALPVPVEGVARAALVDTWGQSRAGGERRHDAIDITAARGTPVIAVTDGRIEKLFESVDGGHTIYLRTPDGGTIYYYAHLDRYRPGLHEGEAVRRGERIATVGATGNASPDAPHLHFSVKRMAAGDGWAAGQAVNPYPLLAEARASR
ncbi:M23 family metallopeptidase [Sphingomonas endophytica]|uniref:Peptidase M23 n=1 Tax=Sphingomonas endophytica TaxID=869719 RepID=A0A147HZS3_9SPHN|nr:M23 family metallopeptidase [Sphingomonas endophytica]KTT70557.1 peptidase M23 [Sphingomonas endophytica]